MEEAVTVTVPGFVPVMVPSGRISASPLPFSTDHSIRGCSAFFGKTTAVSRVGVPVARQSLSPPTISTEET